MLHCLIAAVAVLAIALPPLARRRAWSATCRARTASRSRRSPASRPNMASVRTSEGIRLRTIITRPAGTTRQAAGDLPYAQCGVVRDPRAVPADRLTVSSASSPSARAWSLIRVERAGTGDSEGPGLRQARLRHRGSPLSRGVRPDRAASRGSMPTASSSTAAASARPPRRSSHKGKKVAGIVVQGGGARHLSRADDQFRPALSRTVGQISARSRSTTR